MAFTALPDQILRAQEQLTQQAKVKRGMSLKSSRGLTPYPYTDLPTPTSIRILKVLPKGQNRKGRMSVTLEVVDLKDNPRYTALSYTWGNPCTVYTEDDEILSESHLAANPILGGLRTRGIPDPFRSLNKTFHC